MLLNHDKNGDHRMFEVIVKKNDDSIETYDALNEHQAECVFFRARMQPETLEVKINEMVELEYLT